MTFFLVRIHVIKLTILKKDKKMKTITSKSLFLNFFLCFFTIQSHTKNITLYPEKKIVITIPSYNNKKYYQKNLYSVLSQNYSNFYVIYTDDFSPDGTGDLVEEFLKNNDPQQKVTLIKNSYRKGALHNLYTMIYACEDDAIIVTLDGDDWFPDNDVLSRLNNIYSSDEIWLTYGQFKLHPSNTVGWACPMPDYIVENNNFREFQHLPTHLRTFYAWLFKKIKTEDLLYLGNFYPMTWDMAMMFPMIEMAQERHKFISDIMYIYNDENSLSDHHVSRQLQAYLAQVVKKKTKYQRLNERPSMNATNTNNRADVIIFANTPENLTTFINSLYHYVQNIGSIFVMYRPSTEQETEEFTLIQTLHPEIEFCLISDHRSNFQDALLNLYQKSKNDYILFTKCNTQFKHTISLAECINLLKEIQAYAFYFTLNAHDGIKTYPNMPIVECRDNIFTWNFSLAHEKWSCANSLDLVLHKKKESLHNALLSHYDLTPNGLEAVWANEGNLDRLGLCFKQNYIETI